jgi:hypothetical protein
MRLLLAALALLVATTPAGAQWFDRKTADIPRKADGTPNLTAAAPRAPNGKPDFTGVWNSEAPSSRPVAATFQPWVNDLIRQRQQEYFKTRPTYQCLPSGPEAEKFGGWKRVLQTPTTIAILSDDLTYRVIHMDGRALEAIPAPNWMGYSVGRWEGDTLVVDSNGFNDKTWASRYGVSHTEALRMTERYRRSDFGHLQIEVTFTDSKAYTKPWGFNLTMELAADTEMLESICEKSSDEWAGGLSDAANQAVSVPPDVLAKYVGVYSGLYQGNRRTVEVTLSGGELMATLVSDEALKGALPAAAPRPLVPQSQTLFEGVGLGYQFIVDDKGVATAVVEIHVSGPYKYARQR